MRRRALNLFLSTAMMAVGIFALPASTFAATSGCGTSSYYINFQIKHNGSVDSSGWTYESVYRCWSGGESTQINTQVTNQSYGGGTSMTKHANNHDLVFNTYDRSIEEDFTFTKLSCNFNVIHEIWLDNDDGLAAAKYSSNTSGVTCAGWSIVITSIS